MNPKFILSKAEIEEAFNDEEFIKEVVQALSLLVEEDVEQEVRND